MNRKYKRLYWLTCSVTIDCRCTEHFQNLSHLGVCMFGLPVQEHKYRDERPLKSDQRCTSWGAELLLGAGFGSEP